MWNLLGPVYNHHIYGAVFGLYEDLARSVPPEGPVSYLDVGTGRGYMALQLAASHPDADVTGIDYSATQVRSAERLRRRSGIANCRFQQADALNLPFADASFAGVVTVGSFKHWRDRHQGLAEIHRVLRPGGWIILSETDREVSDGELRSFMKRLSPYRPLDPLLFWGLRNIIFGESFSRKDLAAFAAGVGFVDIAAATSAACPYAVLAARKEMEAACT